MIKWINIECLEGYPAHSTPKDWMSENYYDDDIGIISLIYWQEYENAQNEVACARCNICSFYYVNQVVFRGKSNQFQSKEESEGSSETR